MGPELTLGTLDPGIASVTDGTGAGGAVGPGLADCVRAARVYNEGDNHVNVLSIKQRLVSKSRDRHTVFPRSLIY